MTTHLMSDFYKLNSINLFSKSSTVKTEEVDQQDQQFEIKSYYVCIGAIVITVSQLRRTNYWVYFNALKLRIILSKSQFYKFEMLLYNCSI